LNARCAAAVVVALTVAPWAHGDALHTQATTLREYVAPAVTLTDAEMAAIDRGRPVGKSVTSRSGAEIFVLGIIHINARPEAYAARALDPSRLLALPGYRGTGLIGDPASATGFDGFVLEPDDVDDLQDCRAGDCSLQLPAAIMPAVRAVARQPNREQAAAAANARIRQLAVDLVTQYRERGNAALPVYHDESRPAVAADQLQSLVQRLAALALVPEDVSRFLLDYPSPGSTANVASAFYWEKVVFGLKPTLRLAHAISVTPPPQSPLGCIVAIKQLFATHYLRAAIDVTTCFRTNKPGFYLVTLKASRQEGVTGFTGSLIRRIVVSRARTALDGSLTRIKQALEGSQSLR
jgi:hypothetical protein